MNVAKRLHGQTTRILRSKIAHNAASLSIVQVGRKVIPLIMLPYLGRVLGPPGWGHVALAQSMGDFIAMFAEFGFILSATREIAQNRGSREKCSSIASGTIGAQAILAVLGVLGAIVLSTWIPYLHSHPRLLCAGLVYGAVQGMAPMWFFQGLERMTLAAALEVSSKVVALAGIFLLVRSPDDQWKVLALQALSPLVMVAVGIYLAHRLLDLSLPSKSTISGAMRMGWSMFLLRSGIAAYSTLNTLILGIFAPAPIVGYYASAEKLAKAIAGMTMPIRDAFYPRLSQLAVHSPDENKRLTRLSAVVEGSGGLLLSVATYFGAGFIIRAVFGKSFSGAIPMLHILAVIPFIISLIDAIGFQSLLPAGKEKLVTKAVLAGAAVNIAFAFILASALKGVGMAISAAIAECLVCGILTWVVYRTTGIFGKSVAHPSISDLAQTPMATSSGSSE